MRAGGFLSLFAGVAILVAGCAAPAPPGPGAPAETQGLRCAHDPCSQVVLPAEENAEEPFVAVDPAEPRHIVVVAPVNNNASVEAFRWIGFATSVDGGATWERGFATQDLAGGDPGVAYNIASDAMVAFANDGTVVVAGLAWASADPAAGGLRATRPDIAVWRSTDGGRTFGEGRVVSKALGPASTPAAAGRTGINEDRDFLAVDPATGRLHLTWSRLTNVRPADAVGGPPLGPSSSVVVLATSDDHGATWSEPRALTTVDDGLYGTHIAALEDTVLLLGRSFPGGEPTATLMRSEDGGATWSAPAALGPISPGNYNPPSPVLWRSGENLHAAAAVAEGEGYPRVMLYRSGDGGATWAEPVLVSGDKAATKRHPTLAAEPGTQRQALTFYDSSRGDTDDLDVLLLLLQDGVPTNQTLRLTDATNAPAERLMDYMGLGFGPGGGFAAWDDREGEALRIRGAAFLA